MARNALQRGVAASRVGPGFAGLVGMHVGEWCCVFAVATIARAGLYYLALTATGLHLSPLGSRASWWTSLAAIAGGVTAVDLIVGGWGGTALGVVVFAALVWKLTDAESIEDLTLLWFVVLLFELVIAGTLTAHFARWLDAVVWTP